MRPHVAFACAVLVLTSCGPAGTAEPSAGGGTPNDDGVPPAAEAAAQDYDGGPELLSRTDDVDCAAIERQAKTKDGAAIDILGVRHGMTEKEVRDILICRNASYAINANRHDVSIDDGAQMSRINLVADNGLDRVTVSLVGPEGAERAYHVERVVEYAEGQGLPVESIKTGLAQKYGAFDVWPYDNLQGAIVRSRDGQRLSRSNTSYATCSSHQLQTGMAVPCLNVISYRINPNSQNKALAHRFTISATSHQAVDRMIAAVRTKNQGDLEKAQQVVQAGGLDL